MAVHRNLQHAVPASSKVKLLIQLGMLHPDLRHTALHATYPTLALNSTLSVHCPLHSCPGADPFWQQLAHETSLKSLTVSNSIRYEPKLSTSFMQCIAKLTCLQNLNLKGMGIGPAASELIRGLGCQSTLPALNLSHNELGGGRHMNHVGGPEDIHKLCDAITNLTSLQSLHIGHNNLEDIDVAALGGCITKLPHLQKLFITQCATSRSKDVKGSQSTLPCAQLCVPCGKARMRGVLNSESLSACSLLEHLELPCFPLDARSQTRDLADHFAQLTSLTFLEVGEVFVSDLLALGTSITMLTNLTTLPVTHAYTPAGIDAFGDIVFAMPWLEDISFKGIGVGSDAHASTGATEFATACSKALKLNHIAFWATPMQQVGSKALLANLKNCTVLETLDLHKTDIGDDGARALAQLLPHLRCIENLCIRDHELHDTSFKLLAPKWAPRLHLTSISSAKLTTPPVCQPWHISYLS